MGTEMKPNCSLLAITVFLFCLNTALADSPGPCSIVNCAMGTCDNSSGLIPRCQCNQGWIQPTLPLPVTIPFLPCVIPNCTFNTSCSSAAPPPPPPPPGIATPCAFSICGAGGLCKETSAFSYICKCSEGYENILNMTSAPCVQACALGADCSSLGIGLGGGGTPPASTPPQPDKNKGSATPPSPTNSGVAKVIPPAILMGIVSICFLLTFV